MLASELFVGHWTNNDPEWPTHYVISLYNGQFAVRFWLEGGPEHNAVDVVLEDNKLIFDIGDTTEEIELATPDQLSATEVDFGELYLFEKKGTHPLEGIWRNEEISSCETVIELVDGKWSVSERDYEDGEVFTISAIEFADGGLWYDTVIPSTKRKSKQFLEVVDDDDSLYQEVWSEEIRVRVKEEPPAV